MRRMRESGVDAIMLGRATLGNPWLISQLRDLMEGREARPLPAPADRLRFAIVHYRAMVDELGEARAVPQMRKHVALYLKGIPGRGRAARADHAPRERRRDARRDRRDDRASRVSVRGRSVKKATRPEESGPARSAAYPMTSRALTKHVNFSAGDSVRASSLRVGTRSRHNHARVSECEGAGDDRGTRGALRRRVAASELADETYENYKRYVNPPLARVMKISGSPVEVRASGCTIWDQNGKAYLDFAGGYGVFTLGHNASARRRSRSRAARADGALRQDDVQRHARPRGAAACGARARRSADLVLVQQRHRGDRGRDQTGARRDRTREDRRHHRRVSRKDARRALGERARDLSDAVSAVARRFALRPVRR